MDQSAVLQVQFVAEAFETRSLSATTAAIWALWAMTSMSIYWFIT
jgi:hypothetical protein